MLLLVPLLFLLSQCKNDAGQCADASAGNTHARFSACERSCRFDKSLASCAEGRKVALAACKDKANADRKQLCSYLCDDAESAECREAKAAGLLE